MGTGRYAVDQPRRIAGGLDGYAVDARREAGDQSVRSSGGRSISRASGHSSEGQTLRLDLMTSSPEVIDQPLHDVTDLLFATQVTVADSGLMFAASSLP
jgi:hypothetical protein